MVISAAIACSGRRWQEKLGDVRSEMNKKAASVLVITALDEVACESIYFILYTCCQTIENICDVSLCYRAV